MMLFYEDYVWVSLGNAMKGFTWKCDESKAKQSNESKAK
jgi:hypothetical protein